MTFAVRLHPHTVAFVASSVLSTVFADSDRHIRRVEETVPTDASVGPAPVSHLFRNSGPSDVPRLVVSTVVDPVESEFRTWLGTDVVEEGLEVIDPLIADSDSTTSVMLPTRTVWVVAADFHIRPRYELCRMSPSVSDAGFSPGTVSRQQFTGIATAGPGLATAEILAARYGLVTTVALAQPSRGGATRCISDSLDDNEASELLPCEVVKGSHRSKSYREQRHSCT